MQSPPFPRYLVPPRSKYSPQHHVPKHPQLPFLPQCQRPSFTPIQNNGKIIVLYILIFKFYWNETSRQKSFFYSCLRKLRVIYIDLTLLNPSVATKTLCCPPLLREKRLNSKTKFLTLTLLTWRMWWAPNNASKWQMGFSSAFRGLMKEY